VIGSIAVADIECEAIVGILPHERLTPQPLRLGFSIWLDLEPSARSGDLTQTVNYAQLTDELRLLAIKGKFGLLETMALALAEHTLSCYPLIISVEITCQKTTILPSCSGPTVRMKLDRSALSGDTSAT